MRDEIQKQWKQDIADYGDNAYLIWELRGSVVIRLTGNNAMMVWLKEKPDLLKRKDFCAMPLPV